MHTMNKPPVSFVVAALVPSFGIGYQGQLPWKLKQEMKYFRKLTSATLDPSKRNAVIMGRKTWESIPMKFRPLPNRVNVVLTRNPDNTIIEPSADVVLANCIENALSQLSNVENVFIIGGAEIYKQLVNVVDRIFLTEIRPLSGKDVPMDAFLHLDPSKWSENQQFLQRYLDQHNLGEFPLSDVVEGEFQYRFTVYEKSHQSA